MSVPESECGSAFFECILAIGFFLGVLLLHAEGNQSLHKLSSLVLKEEKNAHCARQIVHSLQQSYIRENLLLGAKNQGEFEVSASLLAPPNCQHTFQIFCSPLTCRILLSSDKQVYGLVQLTPEVL